MTVNLIAGIVVLILANTHANPHKNTATQPTHPCMRTCTPDPHARTHKPSRIAQTLSISWRQVLVNKETSAIEQQLPRSIGGGKYTLVFTTLVAQYPYYNKGTLFWVGSFIRETMTKNKKVKGTTGLPSHRGSPKKVVVGQLPKAHPEPEATVPTYPLRP